MQHFFSKTFLVGEYSVLEKGKALIAVTEPKIDIRLDEKNSIKEVLSSYSKGPVSDLMKSINQYYDVTVNSKNLGLGTSTAVFLSVLRKTRSDFFKEMKFEDKVQTAFKILNLYLACESNKLKTRPSGADILAQYMGLGIWQIDLLNCEVIKLDWVYKDIAFKLIKTGFKTNTHEHLDQLEMTSFSKLNSVNEEAIKAYKSKDMSFVKKISDFSDCLDELGLVHQETKAICDEAYRISGVHAVKGCGALGSDSLFLIYNLNKRHFVENFLEKRNLITYYDSSSSSI
jgi:mevalonate kinase